MAKDFILPNLPNPKGQAELILKSVGLGLLKPKFFKVNESQINKGQTESEFSTGALKSGLFGLPLFDEFRFSASNSNQLRYTPRIEFGTQDVVIASEFIFETALISISQTKNIVRTSIAGNDGTVKEYMSEGDYSISLNGVIAGDVANQRPDTIKLQTLLNYLRAPLAIPITCNFLNEFGITDIVVESYNAGQREGSRNIIDVSIQMISDRSIELSQSV